MSSNAIPTQGTTLKMGATATPTQVIGEITNFQGPGGNATVIDVSTLASVAKEKLMGLPDEGQFQFDINYVPGDVAHNAVIDARATRTKQFFLLTFSNGGTAAWAGYVLGFSVQGGVDAVVAGSVTVEITGAVDWTDPA